MEDNFRIVDVGKFKVPKIPWRTAATALVGLVVLVTAFGTVYQIEPEEVGVIQRFGKYVRTTEPGCTSSCRSSRT